jgi:hypothetical protein
MRKKLKLEQVTIALLSHEMRRKHINDQAMGAEVITLKGRMTDKQSRSKSRMTKDTKSQSDAKKCGVIVLLQENALHKIL